MDPHSSLTYYPHSENQQVFLIDINCDGSIDLLQQAETSTLFRYPFRWIIVAGKSELNISNYFFGVDSKIFIIVEDGARFQIKLPYKITKNDTQLIENDLAIWENGKWVYYNEFSVALNRSNLRGSNFRVSYVLTQPDSVNHLHDYRDKHVDTLGKSFYLAVQPLLDALNVTEKRTIRNTWGYKRPGSSQLDGMLGDMQRNETDLAGTGNTMTHDRLSIQDYVAPGFSIFAAKFVYRAPLLPFVTNMFVLPFDGCVWLSFLALGLVVLLILYVIVVWEWRDPVARDNINPVLRPNIFDVLIMELGAITQQGAEKEPKSFSGRIATLFTFIAMMFIYNAFCANIVALLQTPKDSINSMDDLYTNDITLGAEDVVWCRYFIKVNPYPAMQAIFRDKLTFMSSSEGVRRMRTEYFGFYAERSSIYKIVAETFTEAEKCSLREVTVCNSIPPWFTAPKYSTYKELIRYVLKRMHEAGIVKRVEPLLFTKKPTCNNQGSFGSVGITECRSVYVYFGVGILISFVVFLLEILSKFIRTKLFTKY